MSNMTAEKNMMDDSKLIEMLTRMVKKFSNNQKHELLNYVKIIAKAGDKRNTGRKYFKVTVDYSVKDKFYSDTLENISSGGAFIRTTRPIDVGDDTTMVASIPGMEGSIKAKGKVVRRTEEGVGVKFYEEHKEILSQFYNHFWEI
jgi:Tfp pilus assembly protein PilZ